MNTPPIRDARPADFAQILALNHESVRFLSPLDADRLVLLHGQAAYHRVAEDADGCVAAFLLVLREGASYDSPNYRWFAARHACFLYVDRIVVAEASHGRGLGRKLYEDLFAFARQQACPLVACEFDIDPPNEASRRFHQDFGFSEVGTQTVGAAGKRVSLQAAWLRSQGTA